MYTLHRYWKNRIKFIEKITFDFYSEFELIFAKGGNQNNNIIPGIPVCNKIYVNLLDKLGNKIQCKYWLQKNKNTICAKKSTFLLYAI